LTDEQATSVATQLNSSRILIAELKAACESVYDRRPVTLSFSGDSAALEKLKNDHRLSGYSIEGMQGSAGLALSTQAVLDDRWVVRTAYDMVLLASRYSVNYDGWKTAAVRQGKCR